MAVNGLVPVTCTYGEASRPVVPGSSPAKILLDMPPLGAGCSRPAEPVLAAAPRPIRRAETRELAGGDPASDHFRFTLASLSWQRNRAGHAVGEAAGPGDKILVTEEVGT